MSQRKLTTSLRVLRQYCLHKPPKRQQKQEWLERVALHVLYTILAYYAAPNGFSIPRTLLPRLSFDVLHHVNSLSADVFKRMYRVSKKQYGLLHAILRVTLRKKQKLNH